ncbi:MAG: ComEC/Rec2 family competence protein [Alphaproteobacteria bacterium]
MSFPEARILKPETFIAERDRFPLWMPVLLAVGIGIYFGLEAEPPKRVLYGLTAGMGGLLLIFRRRFLPRLVFIALFLVCMGLMVASVRTQMVAAPYLYKTVYFKEVTGRIDDIEMREDDQKLYLKNVSIEGIKPETTPRRVSISLRKPAPELRVGDTVRAKAMLFPPPQPAMPGAYDFARGFYYEQLGAVGYTPHAVEVIDPVAVNSWLEKLNVTRLEVGARIRAAMSAENGAVASALMVGEQAGVPEELRDAMRDSGLYHVLSISGLHMSLAVGVLYVTIRFLLSLYMPLAIRLPTKKIAAACGLLGAFCYLLLAGYPVPAIRSFIMVACVMVAVLVDRRGISLYSLAWAAMLILLFQPEALVGASFQLSFAATMAIVVLYERYGNLLYQPEIGWLRKLRVYFFGLMLTSLVAALATTPLVIYQFNRVTLWGVGANMLMMPLASLWIMPAAVVSFFAMPFGLEHFPLKTLEQGIAIMIDISRWFAALPYAAFNLPSLTHWGVLLFVFGGLWFCLWERRWRLLGVPLMVISLVTIALHKPYDLVVNDDGNRAMLRLPDGQFLFLRGKADSFESEIWLKAHGADSALTLDDVKNNPDVDCDKNRCIVKAYGRTIVMALRKDVSGICNGKPDMVIAESYLNDSACADVAWRVDKKFLRANGSVAFRFDDAVHAYVAATGRGARPWGEKAYWPLYQIGNTVMMPPFQTKKDEL